MDYRKAYFVLFTAMTNAIECLEEEQIMTEDLCFGFGDESGNIAEKNSGGDAGSGGD
jgi:hypothetical protein